MSEPQGVVELRDIRKRFGDVAAVNGVSLTIRENEFLALLGASGCGKTTLLRIIAGLESADAGQVLIGGEDVTATPAFRRPVNLMFQSYALFPHMTVADNVAFGLKQDGLKGGELRGRVAEALETVELAGLAGRMPDQLSGGQKQRAALARCIAKRPRVLLLDEPLAALDRSLRERTRLELMNLHQRLGIAFVVVTHDQEDAMTMADRVAVMDAGRIVQAAAPRDLYERPATKLVATFFGESNVWAGTVSVCGRRVQCPELGMDVAVADRLPAPGLSVSVSVRPERIGIDAVPLPDDNALADGIVEHVVYLGTQSTYFVRVPHGALIRVVRPNAGGVSFARGARVSVTWPKTAVVVLTS
ncbi:MAG: ABC transporter ATP-binding protein [Rhodospirillaceae bacterium]|nr:ABC transporter ATP-binding protein [Rhodospirillaceae bacterium]